MEEVYTPIFSHGEQANVISLCDITERIKHMSELGNDTSTAAFKLSEKAVSALLLLIKYLMERHEKKLDREIKEAQLEELKAKVDERTASEKLDGKVGYIRARELQKTGEPIVGANITLNDEQMMDFARYAKKYGLLYTSFSDKTVTGEKVHTFLVREKDLHITKSITDRMTEDLNLGKIEEAKQKIISKGEENFTKKDLKDIAFYKRKMEEIYDKSADKINKENAEIIFKDVCGEMKTKSLSFDHALNRVTDRGYSHGKPYYIAERTDPNKYMELVSEKDKFRDKEYTKTNYKVFNDNEQVLDFTDERFEGRQRNFWEVWKNAMREKGGFSDDIVIFNTKDELSRYKELYTNSLVRNTVIEPSKGDDIYYADIIKGLEEQLDKNNAVSIGDGRAADKTTKEPLIMTNAKTNADKIHISENTVIAKQLEIYAAIKEAQNNLKTYNKNLNVVTKKSKNLPETAHNYFTLIAEKSNLTAKIKDAEDNIKMLLGIETELKNERQKLNGITVINEMSVAKENSKQEQVQVRSDFENREHTDRDERGELDSNTLSLTEWQGKVDESRQQIRRDNPHTDKSRTRTYLNTADKKDESTWE